QHLEMLCERVIFVTSHFESSTAVCRAIHYQPRIFRRLSRQSRFKTLWQPDFHGFVRAGEGENEDQGKGQRKDVTMIVNGLFHAWPMFNGTPSGFGDFQFLCVRAGWSLKCRNVENARARVCARMQSSSLAALRWLIALCAISRMTARASSCPARLTCRKTWT